MATRGRETSHNGSFKNASSLKKEGIKNRLAFYF